MPNYGIKAGSNLDTNTDALLDLTSKYSTLKIYKWGDAQYTTDGNGDGSVTIEHDLNYIPIVKVFQKFTAQYTFLAGTTYPNSFREINYWNNYASEDDIYSVINNEELTISTLPAIGFPGQVSAPNTTYYFRYMIFVDLSQAFSDASNINLTGDYGFKVSKPEKNVLTGEEYEMCLSSKYKMLQYYDNHIKTSTLALPAMWASEHDNYVEAATYVDFNHNLGYQPFFMLYSDVDPLSDSLSEIPYQFFSYVPIDTWDGLAEVSAWCDSSRVRVMFRRSSTLVDGFGYSPGEIYDSQTINISIIIFAEDLTGSASP